MVKKRSAIDIKVCLKNFARPTDLHLGFPVFLNRAFTNCSVYKPAKLSSLKLPCRTVCFLVRRTFFYSPTRLSAFPVLRYPGDQKKHLPLRRRRNRPPSLFIALNRLKRGSEQLGHLPLGLVQCFSVMDEFFTVHGQYQEPCN